MNVFSLIALSAAAFLSSRGVSSGQDSRPYRPMLIESRDPGDGCYLAPVHRKALADAANKSAHAARQLAMYYEFCAHDPITAKSWQAKADALDKTSVGNVDRPATSPKGPMAEPPQKEMTVDRYRELTQATRRGSRAAARELADFYSFKDHDFNAAIIWMRRAAELGDVEAASLVVRLEVAIGFRDPSVR